MSQSDLVVTPALAAEHLATQLGHTPELWLHRLANWRRPGRKAPLKAIRTEADHPAYEWSELERFIEGRHATTIAVAAQPKAAPVRVAAIAKLDSEETPHVRVSFAVGSATQSVFAINATTARKLAVMLLKAATAVDVASPQAEADQ